MNPKVTRSSLEMLLVNTFRNITKEESDPLPGHIFISYMATALMLNIHRERVSNIFFPFCEVRFFLSLFLFSFFLCNGLAKESHVILAV